MSTIRLYPHDSESARSADAGRRDRAAARYPRHTPEYQAEVAVLELREIARYGLPDCYPDGFGHDWQADFYANFDTAEAVRLVLADRRLPAVVEALAKASRNNNLSGRRSETACFTGSEVQQSDKLIWRAS